MMRQKSALIFFVLKEKKTYGCKGIEGNVSFSVAGDYCVSRTVEVCSILGDFGSLGLLTDD